MLSPAFSKSGKYFVGIANIYRHSIIGSQRNIKNHTELSRFLHASITLQRRAPESRSSLSSRRKTLELSSASENYVNDAVADPVNGPPPNPLLLEAPNENDELFEKIVSSQKSKKQRGKKNIIILKGVELIKIALAHRVQPQYIFYSKYLSIESLPSFELSAEKILKLKDRTIRDSLGCEMSPGVVGIFSKPTIDEAEWSIPVTVLCTNIREPSNLGSIIAVAAATGCKRILLSKGCADPWEHKVLSTAEGAHFYIPITNNINLANIAEFLPKAAAFYIADSSADIDIDDSHIYTDMEYGDDSQNLPKMASINYLQCNRTTTVDRQGSSMLQPQNVNFETPCHFFSAITFPNKEIVICIGGETEGISPEIQQLGVDLNAQKLKIPLENEMDSLNVCSALSVILFEIQRQFSKKQKTNEL